MQLTVVATVLPLVALAELPDKTMFASLLLAARGRPFPVWVGAAAAFAVHVAIAVTVGVVVFHLFPHRIVDVIVAVLFAGGAVVSWRSRHAEEAAVETVAHSHRRTALTAAGVIFLAEWGDLTQILTANLAARYHDAVSVGVGAVAGLWLVAAVAVIGGSSLLRVISVRKLRMATAVILGALAVWSAVGAATS